MTEERQAIVRYLREISDMYAETPTVLGDDDETRGRVSDTIDVCVQDIENMHPDTCHPLLPRADGDNESQVRWIVAKLRPLKFEKKQVIGAVMCLLEGKSNPKLAAQAYEDLIET